MNNNTTKNRIPKQLSMRKAWACSFLDDQGVLNKRPMMDAKKPASSTDANTWSAAKDLTRHKPARYGFMLSDQDPFVVIDLDAPKNCSAEDLAEFEQNAQETIALFDSYTEVSNSGKGYHIFIEGDLSACGDRCRIGNVEIYETGRYLIVTGNHLNGTPREPQERQAQLKEFYNQTFPAPQEPFIEPQPFDNDHYDPSPNEVRDIITKPCFFKTLNTYNGESAKGNEGSELDAELCMRLAFFTRNPHTIYQLWNESSCARDKVRKKGKEWFLKHNVTSALRAQKDSFEWQVIDDDEGASARDAIEYLKAQFEREREGLKEAKKNDETFLDAIKKQNSGLPPGTAGALAKYFLDGALYPDEQFAICSMLGVVSSIAARSFYFDQGQAPNLYMIAVGGSGSGKDNITKDISRVLAKVDDNTKMIYLSRLCQAMPASKEGVTTALADRGIGSITFLKSEMDKYLAKSSKNETSKQKEVIDEILELYSQSNADYVKYPAPKALKSNQAPPIHAPCVTLVGEGTKDVLFNSLDSSALTGGFVSRLLVIERGSRERKINEVLRTVKRLHNNKDFYAKNGEKEKSEKCAQDLLEYKYVGDDGRMILPDCVLSSLSLLSRRTIEICGYTTNFGIAEDKLEVVGLVDGGETPMTQAPQSQRVLFYPEALDFIDKKDDEINKRMLSDGETRGAAWSRATLKMKNVALNLALINRPDNPIVNMDEIEWAFHYVCNQSKLLANAIDAGEVGGEREVELEALKSALTSALSGNKKIDLWSNGTSKKLLEENQISLPMINRLAVNIRVFRSMSLILRKSSIENCIDLLCADGLLVKLKKEDDEPQKWAFSESLKK